jgi:putative peptidoglycan lipid II flippase
VSVIYQHGAFTMADTIATYKTLIAFAIGLPASLAVKIFASTFYANQDTRTPVKIAVVCVIINLFFNLILMRPLGYVGLALSTSIAIWVNAAMLALYLHKRKLFIADKVFRFRLRRIGAASVIMGLALLILEWHLAICFTEVGLFIKIAALAVLIIAGKLIYGLALFILGVLKPVQMKEYFARK